MGWTFGVEEQLWAGCFSPCSSSLAGSGLEALYGVVGVGQDVAVDGPEDAEEAKGLLAPQLGSQAHGSAGLQDTPIWGALGHEEAADEEAEVLVAGELHQCLWESGSEHGTVWCGVVWCGQTHVQPPGSSPGSPAAPRQLPPGPGWPARCWGRRWHCSLAPGTSPHPQAHRQTLPQGEVLHL